MPKSQFTPAHKSLVAILAAARNEKGLRQEDLAKRLGRKQGFISFVENGHRRIDLIEFCAWARAMDYDPAALFQRVLETLPEKLEI